MNPQWLKLLFEDHLNISASESNEILQGVFNGEIDPHELAIMLVANKITGQTEPDFAANIKKWLLQENYSTTFRSLKKPTLEISLFEHNSKTINVTLTASLVAAHLGAYIFVRDYTATQRSYIGQQFQNKLVIKNLTGDTTYTQAIGDLRKFRFRYQHSTFLQQQIEKYQLDHTTRKQTTLNYLKRNQNYVEGIFSILDNPLRANIYYICVDNPRLIKPITECLTTFSIEKAFIVYSSGVSGFSLHASTSVTKIDKKSVQQTRITPNSASLKAKPWSAIICENEQQIIQTEKAILRGTAEASFKQLVAANAGLMLVAADIFNSLPQATHAALKTINDGEPDLLLNKLIEN